MFGVPQVTYSCPAPATYSPGLTVPFTLRINGVGGFEDPVHLFSVQWAYNSTG